MNDITIGISITFIMEIIRLFAQRQNMLICRLNSRIREAAVLVLPFSRGGGAQRRRGSVRQAPTPVDLYSRGRLYYQKDTKFDLRERLNYYRKGCHIS